MIASAVALVAMWSAEQPLFKNTLRISPLLLVILLGMAIRSCVPLPAALNAGLRMAQRPVLRWAVAGLGFKLSLLELVRIGAPALAVVVVCTFASLWFGWWLARTAGIGRKLGLLLGVGGSVCGASAVVAADTVVQGEKSDAACALGIITLLGTIGIVVYPALARAIGMNEQVYAVWDGASLHEMAQVVAAGYGVSESAARTATVVKLARIALLAPIVIFLGWSLRRAGREAGHAAVAPVPWFLVVFVLCSAVNSIPGLQQDPGAKHLLHRIQVVDLWLLCIGMAGVGLQSGFSDLRASGVRPILVGLGQWVFLAALSLGMAWLFCAS
ncbi:MAG: putative sulfate exporter family transporter [Phycisphaerae bacterium]|nr:putative sulfate exporter family transporter [Phycisphaerae bacterium]